MCLLYSPRFILSSRLCYIILQPPSVKNPPVTLRRGLQVRFLVLLVADEEPEEDTFPYAARAAMVQAYAGVATLS